MSLILEDLQKQLVTVEHRLQLLRNNCYIAIELVNPENLTDCADIYSSNNANKEYTDVVRKTSIEFYLTQKSVLNKKIAILVNK